MNTLKFYYNGIKVNGGELQKCHYSMGNVVNAGADIITIYARNYTRFSAAIRAAFIVENDSDTMTDYFEHDKIRVPANHPLYAAVRAAYDQQEQKTIVRREKRKAARA